MATGKPKEAALVLEEVDRLAPGVSNVQEALAHARAMLGRGSMEGLRADLEAIPLPPSLVEGAKSALASTDTSKLYPGEAWSLREHIQIWDWKQGQDARTTCRQIIEITDTPAIRSFSTLTVAFKGYSEKVNVNSLDVRDTEGKVIASFKRGEMFVQDEAGALANGNKILTIPVPALRKGCVIEFVYTKSLTGTAERFPHVMATIPEVGPLVYGAVAFQGELGKLRFGSTSRLSGSGGTELMTYVTERAGKRSGTSYLPRYDRWGLICWATDKRATWEEEADTYLAEIREYLDRTDFAAGVVEDLELTGKAPEEAVRDIVRWMNRKFRYEGLEFGRRARIPSPGSQTLARGFGDCKDFSVMIRAVLKEVGIDAEIALVNSAGILREDLPSLDQFDHMVVYLPEMDGRILDGTMNHFNTPDALGTGAIGARAFLPESDPPRFVAMRELESTVRTAKITRTVEINPENGDTQVAETCTLSPAYSSMLRYAFSSIAEADRDTFAENAFRRVEPRLDLGGLELENLEDPFAPLIVRLEYKVPSMFQLNDGILSGSVPGVMESLLFKLDPDRDRDIGVEVRSEENLNFQTTVKIPVGFEWLPPEKSELAFSDAPLTEGQLERTKNGESVRIAGHFALKATDGPVENFNRIVTSNNRMFDAMAMRLRFAAKGE